MDTFSKVNGPVLPKEMWIKGFVFSPEKMNLRRFFLQ